MTDTNYTHLTLVVDRSGSMSMTRDDAQGAINTFLDEQANGPGKITLTLIQFDNSIDTVHNLAMLTKDDKITYTLEPRGSTALLDAVARAITLTGDALSSMPEDMRPGQVVVAVVTDGGENASREFGLDAVKKMIATQKDNYKWDFLFLGADDAAWGGATLGASVTVQHANTGAGYHDVYAAASMNMTAVRSAGVSGQSVGLASVWQDNDGTQRLEDEDEPANAGN